MILLMANVAAVPGNSTAPSFATATLPEWIAVAIAFLAVCGVFALVNALHTLRGKLPRSPVPEDSEFARVLRADVKEHSETAGTTILHKLQTYPDSMETLRTQLRSLRSELSDPLEYIDRMKLVAPGYFPNAEISSAYGSWAGAVRTLYRQIDDMHQEMTFPLINEPVVKQRETYLLGQYIVETKLMMRQIDRIKEKAAKLDKLAAKIAKKGKHKDGLGHDAHHDDHYHH